LKAERHSDVTVHAEIVVEPHDVEYPPIAISNHWRSSVKPKRQEGHVIRDRRWDGRPNAIASYFFGSRSVAMRTKKIVPCPLRQLPQRVGQGAFLLSAATLNGVSPDAMAETKGGRFPTGIGGRLRRDDALAPFRIGLFNSKRQCGS
jgi:hypothetical protein